MVWSRFEYNRVNLPELLQTVMQALQFFIIQRINLTI